MLRKHHKDTEKGGGGKSPGNPADHSNFCLENHRTRFMLRNRKTRENDSAGLQRNLLIHDPQSLTIMETKQELSRRLVKPVLYQE